MSGADVSPSKSGRETRQAMPANKARSFRPWAHIREMETTIGRVLTYVMAAGTASTTALTLAYVGHYDFGLSRQQIRTPAVVAAAVIAMVVGIEFFGKKLRRRK
jgi:hypothetical protein